MNKASHPVEVATNYERMLAESPAEGRYIDIGPGHKIHLIEAGAGPPVVFLHGSGGADVARSMSEAIPDNALELLPAGHIPWFGHPEKMGRLILIQDFVLSS